ncbi:MAG: hypothetical protein KKE53_01295 [Proteobacteria bacterium]|nr:hypothetical protein [Pseudomonadota bacterium]
MNALTALQLMVDSGLFILIWLVQLVIYPSFTYTEKKSFSDWHARYTALIGLIVSPMMLTQVGIELFFFTEEVHRLRILLIGLAWLATFSLSAPCHFRLHRQGKDSAIIKRLISTNWTRTLLWSLLFLETTLAVF